MDGSGLIKLRCVDNLRPNNISAGDLPVVVCGVFLYASRNLETLSLKGTFMKFVNSLFHCLYCSLS